jgi:putative DNA primase/helicase
MANKEQWDDREKSLRDKKVSLRSWKELWPAETATFEEAKSLRRRVVKRLQKGNDQERKAARIIAKCRRENRCDSPDCPVCERRRRRRAQRERGPQTTPSRLDHTAPSVVMTRAADIAPEKIEWLWPGRIALGKLSVIAGNPDLGKSQLAAFLAATVSTGREWPCQEGRAPLGTVIMLMAEDDAGDTVVPRLDVANADLSRIHLLNISEGNNGGRPFDLSLDEQVLERIIRRFGDVRLIVIDPITAFLKSTAAQRVAAASLQKLAANLGAAVVAVSHLAKAARTNALAQVTGSLGLVAVARAVFIVAQEKGTDRRLFLPAKNNLASAGSGLAYRTERKMTSDGIASSAVVWDRSSVMVSADEALASDAGGRKLRPALTDAEDFLRVLLAAGPVPSKAVKSEASDAGVSGASLRRAAQNLGLKSYRTGGIAGAGSWHWALPHESAPDDGTARAVTDTSVAPFSAG